MTSTQVIRRHLALLALTTGGVISVDAAAGMIPITSGDEQSGMHIAVARGAIVDNNESDIGGGDAWVRTGILQEQTGAFTNDKVFVSGGTVVHHKAPHSEAANAGNVFTFSFEAIADGFTDKIVKPNPLTSRFPHETHFDHYQATFNARVDADTFSGGEIETWNLLVRGVHTLGSTHDFSGTLTSAQVPGGGGGNALGLLNVFLVGGELDFAVSIAQTTLADYQGGQIRRGAVGEIGEVILDLGGASLWTDLNGGGISRMLKTPFPTVFLSDLLTGNTYVQIDTLSFPNGAIRGQLAPVPELPVAWLFAAGLAAIALRRRPTHAG